VAITSAGAPRRFAEEDIARGARPGGLEPGDAPVDPDDVREAL